MTFTDGIHTGLWLLGVLCVLGAVACLIAAVWAIDVPHRVRVVRMRRVARRSGRR